MRTKVAAILFLSLSLGKGVMVGQNMYTAFDSLMHTPAPEFKLTSMGGVVYDLNKLKGKIIVLNFWFVNCTPCINEMPDLYEMKETYKDSNVVFLSICMDEPVSIKEVQKKYGIKFDVIPSAYGLRDLYKIKYYPATCIINEKGIIDFAFEAANPEYVRRNLIRIIRQKK